MKILLDADACSVAIKEILFKAAKRKQVNLILVANKPLYTPSSNYIKSIQVKSGFDVADNEIVKLSEPGDLIITSDIPLACELIEKGAYALSPRGEMFSADTIKSRRNMRDFMDTLRSSGIHSGGPSPFGQKERQAFANHLDVFLTKNS